MCNEKNLKELKPNLILEQMFQNLKVLEETGITFTINNQSKTIKGSIFAESLKRHRERETAQETLA